MNPVEKAKWLKEVFDGVSWGAQQDLKRTGHLPPLGILVGEDLPDAIMPLCFDTPQVKTDCLTILGVIAKEQGYDAVIVVSEAWMSTQQMEDRDKEHPMPSKDPNRTEAIISCMKQRDGSEQLRVMTFSRGAEGKIEKIEEPKKFDGTSIHMGMMDVIFPQDHSTH